MKKILVFPLVYLVLVLLPHHAFADMGPKPSVNIEFKGITEDIYYITLITPDIPAPYDYNPNGFDPDWEEMEYELEETYIDMAFRGYVDIDGFKYCEYGGKNNIKDNFSWNYYPPETFKILLYFPETDRYVVSEIYERYAFDSIFYAEYVNGQLFVSEKIDFLWHITSFIARMLATVGIELAIAYYLFRFRSKKAVEIIVKTNIITQFMLNILLNLSFWFGGILSLLLVYFLLECLVFLVEATIYKGAFHKLGIKGFPIIYAFVANIISFFLGCLISILTTF